MNMSSGGWLNIAGGQLWNGGWQNITWSANQSSLNIANGARFDMADGQSVYVDALTGSGTVDKNTAGSIVLNIGVNGGGGTFNGIIQNTLGAIELIKTGTGVQVLSGANSYSGATVINGGILRLDNPLALGGTSGIAVSNSTLVLNTAGVAITAPITINGNGGDNGYSYTSIAAPGGGTSYLGGLLTVGASGGRIWGTFSGGTTLIVTGGISGAGNQLLLYGESGTITLTNNPVVLGTLNAFGLNICVANNAVSNLIAEWGGGSAGINLNVANAFTNAPSLTIGNSNPSSFGLLNLNNYKLTVSSITNCVGSSDVITGGPSATLTVSNVSSQCYYNGSIKGVGLSLTKNGAGTLIIAGTNNTYTGATTINGGTLLIEGALNSGGGNVSVNSGGTLSGTGTVNRAIAINSGATLSPGDNNPGVLMIGSNCILNAGAILNYRLGFTNDQVIVTGNLTLGGTLNITDSGGFTTGTYTLFTYSGALTNNVLNIGATPDSSLVYQIDANTVDQVRLVVLTQFAAWQLQYFGCTNCPNAAPAADPYGKGMSNTNQFLAGLNPTNSASVFRVSKVAPNSSGFLVSWPSVPGKTYKVLYSDSPGGPWQEDLPSSQITADTGQTSLSYTDATIGSAVRRFYRIRLVTP